MSNKTPHNTSERRKPTNKATKNNTFTSEQRIIQSNQGKQNYEQSTMPVKDKTSHT